MMMIRILLTLLFISSTSFAASNSSDDSETSISASEQVTKLYDKAYELVYYKKFDKSIKLLEKIAKRKDLGEKKLMYITYLVLVTESIVSQI